MKPLTIKYPSGREVSLAAFLLKMTSLDNHARTLSINRERSDIKDAETRHLTIKRGRDMNASLFKGEWNEFKGDLRQEWGRFTDDDLVKIDGEYDKFMVVALERYPGRRAEVGRWADEWYSVVQFPAAP